MTGYLLLLLYRGTIGKRLDRKEVAEREKMFAELRREKELNRMKQDITRAMNSLQEPPGKSSEREGVSTSESTSKTLGGK